MKNEKRIYALGFFDGVHLGHQALLRECRRLADESFCAAAAGWRMSPSVLPPPLLLTRTLSPYFPNIPRR